MSSKPEARRASGPKSGERLGPKELEDPQERGCCRCTRCEGSCRHGCRCRGCCRAHSGSHC
eukprot:14176607-Alexandrium_andersonii.AAC.1